VVGPLDDADLSVLEVIDRRQQVVAMEIERAARFMNGFGEVQVAFALRVHVEAGVDIGLAVAHGLECFRPGADAELDRNTRDLAPQPPHIHIEAERFTVRRQDGERWVIVGDGDAQPFAGFGRRGGSAGEGACAGDHQHH